MEMRWFGGDGSQLSENSLIVKRRYVRRRDLCTDNARRSDRMEVKSTCQLEAAAPASRHLSVSVDFDVAEALTQPDVDRYVSGQRRTHYADESVIASAPDSILVLRQRRNDSRNDSTSTCSASAIPGSPAYLTRSLSIACPNRQRISYRFHTKTFSRMLVTVASRLVRQSRPIKRSIKWQMMNTRFR